MRDHERSIEGPGRRSSRGRVAQLLCELRPHTDAGDSVDLPQSLTLTGDALGLTPVHLLATLQRLGAEGLIVTAGRTVTILDIDRLRALADVAPV